MADIISNGKNHQNEANFFNELLDLLKKYNVEIFPGEQDLTEEQKKLYSQDKQPIIIFDFPNGLNFSNQDVPVDWHCVNGFENNDDEDDVISINGKQN